MSDRKIIIANVIIHGFALAHAITAAALSQTLVGDEAALTAMTTAMIIVIALLYGRSYSIGKALALIGTFGGFYLGTRGAVFLIKWIPGIGNAANAITTTVVTEMLGWATYIIVKSGQDPENITKKQAKEIWKKAGELRVEMKSEQEKIKNAIERMTISDKALYNSLMEELKDKYTSELRIKQAEYELDELFKKYGI